MSFDKSDRAVAKKLAGLQESGFSEHVVSRRANSVAGEVSGKPDIRVISSVAVLAEILLRSPWKIFIFIIKKYVYRIKVSKKLII